MTQSLDEADVAEDHDGERNQSCDESGHGVVGRLEGRIVEKQVGVLVGVSATAGVNEILVDFVKIRGFSQRV